MVKCAAQGRSYHTEVRRKKETIAPHPTFPAPQPTPPPISVSLVTPMAKGERRYFKKKRSKRRKEKKEEN